MKNTTQLGLFVVHKIVSEYVESIETYSKNSQKVFLKENLEKTPKEFSYSPNTPRDIKLSLSWRIFVQNQHLDLRSSTYSRQDRVTKKTFRATVTLTVHVMHRDGINNVLNLITCYGGDKGQDAIQSLIWTALQSPQLCTVKNWVKTVFFMCDVHFQGKKNFYLWCLILFLTMISHTLLWVFFLAVHATSSVCHYPCRSRQNLHS